MASSPKSAGGNAEVPYQMPSPGSFVVWRNAPGGDSCVAAVTRVGKSAISVMLFPPDSRVGVPKDAVRFAGDPQVKTKGIDPDSGVRDFTPEAKLLQSIVGKTNV